MRLIKVPVEKRIFIAGIIQGSCEGKGIWSQNYRGRLKAILSEAFPEWQIYCPVENHPESVEYTNEEAQETFTHHIDLVKSSSLVVSYLPSASMGTAVEMWEAYQNGIPVWTITPMTENWVTRITSTRIFATLEALEKFLRENRNSLTPVLQKTGQSL